MAKHTYTVTVTNAKGKVTTHTCPTYRAVKDMWKEPLRNGDLVTAQRITVADEKPAPAAKPSTAAKAAKGAAKAAKAAKPAKAAKAS